MIKVITRGLLLVALFFAAWFALKQIDWVSIFEVHEMTSKTEEKLGDLFWETYKKVERENKDPFSVEAIDSLVQKICSENNIDPEEIKVHLLNKDEVNAFALPDGHLVIYSGLISAADNQEELSGVICHEIAHIRLNHVMKKLVKEVGLSVLISMTTGNGSGEAIKEAARMLSSSSFDRSLEKDADIKAVEYLINAKIDPEPFADFLFSLSGEEDEASKYFSWISTHPDSKERAEYIIETCKDSKTDFEQVLAEETWDKLQSIAEGYQ